MNVLGIETSCDETSAAVVGADRRVLANVVFTQAHLHGPYGGVVPEIASRAHLEHLPGVIEQAMAGLAWPQIDEIAVTYGPGLASSLLVGVAAAKGLALRLGKPLVAINHLHAHIYSVFLREGAPMPDSACPFLALVVSGGHSCLVRVERLGVCRLLGQTLDDAAGEAFDKGANLLGLGYPGGPAIDKASRGGDPDKVRFPRGRQRRERGALGGLDPDLCFSFSGVKTSLMYYLKGHALSDDARERSAIAASYQEAIVDALVERCDRALRSERCLAVAGGVSLNSRLRARLTEWATRRNVTLLLAEPGHCADNAAMVAGLAAAGHGIRGPAALALDIDPNLPIASLP